MTQRESARFTHEGEGNPIWRTDADQRNIALRYDALGRMVESKDGLGRSTYFAFDELGNLVERVDGAGERLRMEHDSSGRVVRRTSAGSGSAAPIDDRYRFDGFGRMVLARNAHTTLTFGYDALDRALSVTDSASGTAQLRYDADGRTVQAIYPNGAAYGYPEGVSVHYLYNARSQLQAVVDPVAGIWQLEYDAAGRAVRRIDPSGVQRRVIYDDAGDGYGFVERVEISAPGVQENYVYRGYDLLGNPSFIDHTSLPNVVRTTGISYDSLSRVRSVIYPTGEGEESFEYDRVGNRTTHENRQGQVRAYTTDAAHQLTEIREGTGTNALVERFVYDGAGRRRQRISAGNALLESYAYDARGALTEYTQASGYTFSLYNDAMGYRRERSEPAGDARYFGEWTEHRGGKRHRMVFGSGLGAPLAEIGDGDPNQPQVVRALHEDGTANVTHVTATSAGGFESVRRYEAFGARLNSATTEVERSFAGRPTEGASGLLRMGARHYDPSTGTFLQVDPLVLETNQAYAYASQNPYRFWDPTGLRGSTINTSAPWSSSPSNSYGSAYSSYSSSSLSSPSYGVTRTSVFDSPSYSRSSSDSQYAAPIGPNQLPSANAIRLIEQFEDFRPTVYKDVVGIPTVGFGHRVLPGEDFSRPLSVDQGRALLAADVNRVVLPSLALVNVALSQNQVDALASFAFNIGQTEFAGSTALRFVNSGRLAEVPPAMALYNKATLQGRKEFFPGLANRRAMEGVLFMDGQ